VLLVALVAGPANLRTVYGTAEAVAHTQAARAALQELLTTTIDAETGQRGFIITGDESYLEPYTRSQRTIETDVVSADDRREWAREGGAARDSQWRPAQYRVARALDS
jgi:CHASE3 domain sensor protein